MKNEGFRVGFGYDIHPLREGRRLVLGGVVIEHETGLEGHSDADVLVHALCDALLGAANLGDLGGHFPENEDYKDADSLKILKSVAGMLEREGYRLINADCVIGAEAPRLSPHAGEMAVNIGGALEADPANISIKSTRGEGMGPVGERKAIEARVVVLISGKDA